MGATRWVRTPSARASFSRAIFASSSTVLSPAGDRGCSSSDASSICSPSPSPAPGRANVTVSESSFVDSFENAAAGIASEEEASRWPGSMPRVEKVGLVRAGVQDAPIAPGGARRPGRHGAARAGRSRKAAAIFCSQHKNGSVRTAAVAAHHPLGQVLRACVDGCSLR
jgi:hypothetical protein